MAEFTGECLNRTEHKEDYEKRVKKLKKKNKKLKGMVKSKGK